jgi:hypothetical protein
MCAGIGDLLGPSHAPTHVIAKKLETNLLTFDDMVTLQHSIKQFEKVIYLRYMGPPLTTRVQARTFFKDPNATSRAAQLH